MKIAILGTRGIPNNYGGFEQCAEYLSIGLAQKGHDVTVYSPHFHPYKENVYKGIKIIKKLSPENLFGNSASNFFYDYLCFKDATGKDFDIILELGLITASLSIIFCSHKGKIVVTNLDGLEWKRAKWSKLVQKLTKQLEKYGVKHSDYLIADNVGILQYIKKEYHLESEFIAYGAVDVLPPVDTCLNNYGITKDNYFLSIARLEPENNLEMMFDAYISSKSQIPYYVVGNHTTPYGDLLKDKYRNKGIVFLGGIFNKMHLDNIRYYSKLYIHGHSVGGTNPALLEAMAAKTLILAHGNIFNRSVLGENAFYFLSSDELSKLFTEDLELKKAEFITNNLNKIDKIYRWSVVVDQYESYFESILKASKKQ
jgi:glycosyltransferase involved in cell wall biosynthesis